MSDHGDLDAVPATPPSGLLSAGAVLALGAAALWPIGELWAHVTGYVFSTFLGLGAVAAFTRVDLRRRQNPYYSPRSHVRWTRLAVAALSVAVACAHVWVIAVWTS